MLRYYDVEYYQRKRIIRKTVRASDEKEAESIIRKLYSDKIQSVKLNPLMNKGQIKW